MGRQRGSIYLGRQKVPIAVPRVRNLRARKEIPLATYRALQRPREVDDRLLLEVLKGISCRNYEGCVGDVPEAFGISSSTVSRQFVQASAYRLKAFQERSLEDLDLVALVLDGTRFGNSEMIIALGITMEGQKIPLAFVESATENETVCRQPSEI